MRVSVFECAFCPFVLSSFSFIYLNAADNIVRDLVCSSSSSFAGQITTFRFCSILPRARLRARPPVTNFFRSILVYALFRVAFWLPTVAEQCVRVCVCERISLRVWMYYGCGRLAACMRQYNTCVCVCSLVV